ncbi:Hypothetical predicted protein, partial [Mytilus galloprovincialis]
SCSKNKRSCGYDVRSTIQSRCRGQKCSIAASNDMFGDPCYEIKKYLHVSYECIE